MSGHLKPEEMNDWLLGIASGEATAHVRICSECRAQIEGVRQTLECFRDAAVSWSEEAATRVAVRPKAAMPWPWPRPVWVMAASVLILALVIPLALRRGHNRNSGAAAHAQAQISRDNQLLAHIESDLGETTPLPMQPLQVNSK